MAQFLQKQNILTVVVIIATLIYMLLGAAIFHVIEEGPHKTEMKKFRGEYQGLKNRFNMTDADLKELMFYLHKRRYLDGSALEPWDFLGSFYFTTVTITTIGYGHSVPQTTSGMVFLFIYACFGIPLNITMFQHTGERMGVLLSYALRRLKRWCHMKNTDVPLIHLITFAIVIWLVFLMIGAELFAHYESWTYWMSLYYFFITLTTIGFGDKVALQQINRNDPSNNAYNSQHGYIAATIIIIYTGLIFTSTIVNLMVMGLMELQQPRKKRKPTSWSNGPRCKHCKHMNNPSEDNANNVLENESIAILQNFEEEIAFTSYKQVHENIVC